MSEMSRSRLYEIGQKKLDLEAEEWQFICEHIGDFCMMSDQKVKEKFGIEANEDICVGKEQMTDDQFIEFVKPIIQEILERYGKRKRKRKAKLSQAEQDEDYNQFLMVKEAQRMQERVAQEQKLQGQGERRFN